MAKIKSAPGFGFILLVMAGIYVGLAYLFFGYPMTPLEIFCLIAAILGTGFLIARWNNS